MTDAQFLLMLQENGYQCVRREKNGDWSGLMPLAFTWAIVTDLNMTGYGDRWCYKTYTQAREALEAWDGTGEPDGWHRHPPTGRRVDEDGNKYVNF